MILLSSYQHGDNYQFLCNFRLANDETKLCLCPKTLKCHPMVWVCIEPSNKPNPTWRHRWWWLLQYQIAILDIAMSVNLVVEKLRCYRDKIETSSYGLRVQSLMLISTNRDKNCGISCAYSSVGKIMLVLLQLFISCKQHELQKYYSSRLIF